MIMSFPRPILASDAEPPRCHCIACGTLLPIIHSVDHLCDACFDEALSELVAHLDELFVEVDDDSQKE